MKLLTERPPQLMPAIMLPARLSRRGRATSRLGLAMEMGLALTKEDSWRPWATAASSEGPVVMSTSASGSVRPREKASRRAAATAGGDGEREARGGGGMRMGLADDSAADEGLKRPAEGERGVAGWGEGVGDGDESMRGEGEGKSAEGEAR